MENFHSILFSKKSGHTNMPEKSMDDSLGLVDRGGVIAEETEGEDVDDPFPFEI